MWAMMEKLRVSSTDMVIWQAGNKGNFLKMKEWNELIFNLRKSGSRLISLI
jgi:hypothetical protein